MSVVQHGITAALPCSFTHLLPELPFSHAYFASEFFFQKKMITQGLQSQELASCLDNGEVEEGPLTPELARRRDRSPPPVPGQSPQLAQPGHLAVTT